MELPKKYLSYSAISLWERSKDGFRKRYYENEKPVETPEMVYGKKIAKMLEVGAFDDDPTLALIPRYSAPEHKMEVMIDGVPILGYIDSFDPEKNRFLEYKTGRNGANDAPRWDRVKVYETDQLPLYSLLIKEKYGIVENLCHLVWLRTIFDQKSVEFDGLTLTSDSKDVKLDGHFQVFERIVFEYERKAMREKILRVAEEISKDYENYQRIERSLPSAPEAVIR